jgi:hypothetical protein
MKATLKTRTANWRFTERNVSEPQCFIKIVCKTGQPPPLAVPPPSGLLEATPVSGFAEGVPVSGLLGAAPDAVAVWLEAVELAFALPVLGAVPPLSGLLDAIPVSGFADGVPVSGFDDKTPSSPATEATALLTGAVFIVVFEELVTATEGVFVIAILGEVATIGLGGATKGFKGAT